MEKATLNQRLLLMGVAFVFLAGCGGSRSRLKVGVTDEGEVVEAVGYATNEPGEILKTKRAALTDAQRNAIEKVVGVYVSARTMVEQAIAIENNILSQTEGYVKKYDILEEGPNAEGLYHMKIRALVALKDLEADLKDMALLNRPPLQRPRVKVSLTESIDKHPIDDSPAARSLENELIDQGFIIVNSSEDEQSELEMTGKATSFPFETEGLGGFVSYRARISMQVKRPGTNGVLLSISKEASGLGGSAELAGLKSLEVVGKLVATEVSEKLSEAWAKGQNVLIIVNGIKAFEDVDRIRKHLITQPGVVDLVLREYDGDLARFEVQLRGAQTSDLAAQLQKSKTLALEVLEVKPQSLWLKLQ